MPDKKYIDKQYLLKSLRDFDKEILSKKYNDSSVTKGEPGENGITPHIGDNGNWFIGDTDTNISASGKDGNSISEIILDSNNNISVIFTDGTIQNIGSLSINIEADFLTENGFGNLRYYQGKMQYYNINTDTWVETSVTPDNIYIFKMMPQPMKNICGIYDIEEKHYKLMFEEPADTIIDNQVACLVEKVIIRRKQGENPTDEFDGILVEEITRDHFKKFKNTWYVDDSFSPIMGEEWFYKAFPISSTGFVNKALENSTGGIIAKDYYLFGFKIDQNETAPEDMIVYIEDNQKFKSAYMDYSTDRFNYGSWEDMWFMKVRPCMLNYDGTVAYYLNPNDYTKKIDNTNSDVNNSDFAGNAMVAIPKIYWKIFDNGDNTANVYICNKKIDADFNCWSHLDSNGNEINYCYLPIYNCNFVNGKARSLSGQVPIRNVTRHQEIDYAKANNIEENEEWYTEVYSDRMLINLLLLLIGKSTNTQQIFGSGNNNSYVNSSNSGVIVSGEMDKKGVFWGKQDNVSGVKVFGMEHYWGNVWRGVAGIINSYGIPKIKLTYGMSDGSTVSGYNITGSGYITISDVVYTGFTYGYLSVCKFDKFGLIPKQVSGSSTTKWCDSSYFASDAVNYVLIGGDSSFSHEVGAFFFNMAVLPGHQNVLFGASISCKPLAIKEGDV